MKTLNLHITGHVQGVFFRSTAKRIADQLGVRGWIQNELDGSVRAQVQGNEEALAEFLTWCHRGSDMSEVSQVEVAEIEAVTDDYQDFRIHRST